MTATHADTWNGGTGKFEDPTAWGLTTVPSSASSTFFVLDTDGAHCLADAATWTYLTNNSLLNTSVRYRGVSRTLFGNTAGAKTISFTLDIGAGNMFQLTQNAAGHIAEKTDNDVTVNILSGIFETGNSITLASASSATGTLNISGGEFRVGRSDLNIGDSDGGTALVSISGGRLKTRAGLSIGLNGNLEIIGSTTLEIGIGSQGSLDGFATINGTISPQIDASGVTPIFVDDLGGGTSATFNSGSLLDPSFLAPTPDTVGTWTVLELEGADIVDNGLALTTAATTAGWTFNVDNSGLNGLLTVSWGVAAPEPALFWSGDISDDWDTTTLNWLDGVTPALYIDNSPLTFDAFAFSYSVNLTTSVSPASITVIEDEDYTFSGTGSITGDTGIIKSGPSSLALNNSGASDFTGSIIINEGDITLGNATAFGASSGDVSLVGGDLDLGGFSVTKGDVSILDGILSNGTLTATSVAVQEGTISANIAGAGTTVTKSGVGTLILSGANTYDGATEINGGIVKLTSATALGASTGVTTLNAGGTLDLNGQTITEEFDQIVGTFINSDTVNPAQIINDLSGPLFGNPTFGGAGDIIVEDVIKEGTNTRRITKEGTGTLTFGGDEINNRYGLTVTEGNVNLAATVDGAFVVGRFSLVMNSVGGTVLLQNSNDQIHNNIDQNGRMEINTGTLDLNGLDEDFGALITTNGTEIDGVVTNSNVGTTSTLTLLGSFYDSADQPAAFPGTVSGNLNLVKNGNNVQTLSGALTYTGNTTINAGTLEISNAASNLNDASVVTITDGVLSLSNGVTDVVDQLWIDGVQQASGTYGSTGSSATNTDDTHFAVASTGLLSVTSGPAVTDYGTWATDNSVVGGPTDDDDLDGATNEEEYAFATDPTSGSSLSAYSAVDTTSGTFTYTRRNPALSGLSYSYQFSTDLVDFTIGDIYTPVESSDSGTPIETITVTIPAPLLGDKLFLKVEAN